MRIGRPDEERRDEGVAGGERHQVRAVPVPDAVIDAAASAVEEHEPLRPTDAQGETGGERRRRTRPAEPVQIDACAGSGRRAATGTPALVGDGGRDYQQDDPDEELERRRGARVVVVAPHGGEYEAPTATRTAQVVSCAATNPEREGESLKPAALDHRDRRREAERLKVARRA